MPSDLTEMNSSLIDDGCAGCSISHPTQALPNPATSIWPSLSPFREPCPIPQQFGQTGRSSRARQGVVVTSEKCATSTRRGALEAATQASLTHSHTHVSLSSSSSAINDIWAPLCATIRLNNDAGVSPRRDGRPETGADESGRNERVRITNQS